MSRLERETGMHELARARTVRALSATRPCPSTASFGARSQVLLLVTRTLVSFGRGLQLHQEKVRNSHGDTRGEVTGPLWVLL